MAAKKKQPAKASAKKAKPDVNGLYPQLVKNVNARLQKAEQAEGKADDFRLGAALMLDEAKRKCKDDGVSFKAWCEANVTWAYDTVRKLARIGGADDPKAALEDLRGRTKTQQAKSRKKKAAAAQDAVAVAETAVATMSDDQAEKFIEKAASSRGMSVAASADAAPAGANALERANFAFDDLDANDRIRHLAYVAKVTGAEAKLFGQDVAKEAEKLAKKKTRRKK